MTAEAPTRGRLEKIRDDCQFYPHQMEGVRKMARIGSFLLADEMGLGKSLQAITVAAIDFELGYAKRVLVVCPVSLKWNWGEELDKFTSFSYTILDGTPKARSRQLHEFEFFDKEVLVVNYEQVRSHLDDLNDLGFDIVIWDEAHYLKNPSSKRTKASLKLRAKRKFFLTGSPLLNQVNELWVILHLINPDEFPAYRRFVNRYCVFGGFKGKQVMGTANKDELIGRLDEVMIRRRKQDVLDLPEKQYIQIKVDLHPEQKKLYEEASRDLQITLPHSPTPMELENALTKFLRLKEICGSTYKFTGEDHSTKLDVAVEKALEIVENGEPIVLWTQFRPINERLVARLKEKGVETFELHGGVDKQYRADVIKKWGAYRSDQGHGAALVAGLQVASVGLNMTQANKCIFVDKLFVPKLNEQAEDRLHRIGADLTKPIQIIEIITRNTIESRIETILKQKRKLFDMMVDNTEWKKSLYEALREDDLVHE